MTYLAEVVIMIGGLVTFHLVAARYGPHGFGAYQLARGLISLVAPVAGLGLATSFLKYLPGLPDARRVLTVIIIALAGSLGTLCVLIALLARVADIGFGLFQSDFGLATYVLAAATTLLTLVLSGLRGVSMPIWSSILGSLALGAAPLVAVGISGSLTAMFWTQSVTLVLLMTAAVVGWYAHDWIRSSKGPSQDLRGSGAAKVLRYGISRVPGDTALPLVFVLPTLYVGYAGERRSQAGYMGFATSVVLLGCSALATLTPILLPRFSGRLSRGSSLSTRWTVLAPIVVTVAAAICTLVGEISSPWVVDWYLGQQFEPAAGVVRGCLLAAVPLSLYYYSRVVLDAVHSYAWSARTAFIGFCIGAVVGLTCRVWADALVAGQAAFIASAVSMGASALYSLVNMRN